ncbi:hypothetical protein DFH27DRAFT_610439 [Peziza echinospora]|nr:hypothetical protein DFH27DRAFT_610439 [Peziza echinospora]
MRALWMRIKIFKDTSRPPRICPANNSNEKSVCAAAIALDCVRLSPPSQTSGRGCLGRWRLGATCCANGLARPATSAAVCPFAVVAGACRGSCETLQHASSLSRARRHRHHRGLAHPPQPPPSPPPAPAPQRPPPDAP